MQLATATGSTQVPLCAEIPQYTPLIHHLKYHTCRLTAWGTFNMLRQITADLWLMPSACRGHLALISQYMNDSQLFTTYVAGQPEAAAPAGQPHSCGSARDHEQAPFSAEDPNAAINGVDEHQGRPFQALQPQTVQHRSFTGHALEQQEEATVFHSRGHITWQQLSPLGQQQQQWNLSGLRAAAPQLCFQSNHNASQLRWPPQLCWPSQQARLAGMSTASKSKPWQQQQQQQQKPPQQQQQQSRGGPEAPKQRRNHQITAPSLMVVFPDGTKQVRDRLKLLPDLGAGGGNGAEDRDS